MQIRIREKVIRKGRRKEGVGCGVGGGSKRGGGVHGDVFRLRFRKNNRGLASVLLVSHGDGK